MTDQPQGPVAQEIRLRLFNEFGPSHLEVSDDSAQHHGHTGHDPRGESHFSVTVVSELFAGRSRVERQRMVNTTLRDLLEQRIHALSIRALTPDEAGA